MPTRVSLTPRDLSLLRLLGWTPATTALLLRASTAFDGGAFADERRLRERLQSFQSAALVRAWSTATSGGGLQNYYKLTPAGFGTLHGPDAARPPHAFFAEVVPSVFVHTFRLAEAVIEVYRATHARRIEIDRFSRENELTFEVGDDRIQPDAFFRLSAAGRNFHLAFEIDGSTESVDSPAANSIRRKLALYDAYQERVMSQWSAAGKTWERPRLRVVFLTPSVARAYHILALAARVTQRPARRLFYAAAHAAFVGDADPLCAPIFLDHRGGWQALVDLHPSAPFRKIPIRLTPTVESAFAIS
jgi:hypothetical protein